jgi:hypothetical protein
MRYLPTLLTTACAVLAACGDRGPTQPSNDPITFSFDFNAGEQGWIADFVDFPTDREGDVGFVSDHRSLPPPLDGAGKALYHEGLNLSDDLFMYYKRQVDGLEPGASYRVTFHVGFATRLGRDCAAGLGLLLKAGAVADEPVRVIGTAEGWYRLSADKGGGAVVGSEAVLLGEIRNDDPGCSGEFGLGMLGEGVGPLVATAGEDGSIWLFFGEESVFEGFHELHYTAFEAVCEKL